MTRKRFIKLLMASYAFDRNQANDIAEFYIDHHKVYPHNYDDISKMILFG